jgi:hypothetical protein
MRPLAIGALFVTLVAVRSARAEDEDRAATFARLSDDGAALYLSRDFEKAAEKFREAYAIEPDPNLIFDIARCQQALGHTAAAIEGFEQYLKADGTEPRGRAKAEESLRQLRSGDHGRLPIVAIGLGAAGVVAAAIGTVVYLGGVSDHAQVEDAANYGNGSKIYGLTRVRAQELVDSGDRKKLEGGILLGVGGALLGASALVFFLSRRASSTVGFSVAPAYGGASMRGSF